MEDVDLGEDIRPLYYEESSDGSNQSDGGGRSEDDDIKPNQPQQQEHERFSQRLRGSLQRRVTPLYGLRHSIATTTVDGSIGKASGGSARERVRTAMVRMRRRNDRADNQTNADVSNAADGAVLMPKYSMKPVRSTMASAGLRIIHEDRLVLLGQTPLVQPQDDILFLERTLASSTTQTVQRGDYIRIQSSDDPSQSWLCQVAVDKLYSEPDVLPLATPFPGPLVPDALVHFVPRECVPQGATVDDNDNQDENDSSSSEEDEEPEQVTELRTSLDGWRPSVDDVAYSTDEDALSTSHREDAAPRGSVARDKAAAFYEKYKSKKARLRTSSSDYKEKLVAASQISKQKLAVASQVSKQKLAVAGSVSKEKMAVATQVSKEKLAVASQASKEKLAAASVVSKEKLAVASQASKEKLVVAGQASKLKMQSWTSSAKSSLRAKMAQRAEQKMMAATAATHVQAMDAVEYDTERMVALPATPSGDEKRIDEDAVRWSYEPTVDDLGEEELLRREVDEC